MATERQVEPSARLAEAAPDMLAALKPLAEQHTPDGYSGHDHIHCSITVDQVLAARAAIAKATGKA